MTFAQRSRTLVALVLLTAAIPLWTQTPKQQIRAGTPTESEHIRGPHGLEGWTLNWAIPSSGYGDEKLPLTLVLARDGHVLRRIDGDAFIWQWIFWADGRQVAYESGPLHFGLDCVLYDLEKGRELSRVDCYHELPADTPDWVGALESATRPQTTKKP
jgi:hypothetical protein